MQRDAVRILVPNAQARCPVRDKYTERRYVRPGQPMLSPQSTPISTHPIPQDYRREISTRFQSKDIHTTDAHANTEVGERSKMRTLPA